MPADASMHPSLWSDLRRLPRGYWILFSGTLTSFTRRHPGPRMMMWGYLLSGAGIGLSAFGGSMPLLVAVMVVFTLGEMISSPVANA